MARQISQREVADYLLSLIETGSGATPEPEARLLTEKLAHVMRILEVSNFHANVEDGKFTTAFPVIHQTFLHLEGKVVGDLAKLCDTIGYQFKLKNYVISVTKDLKVDPVAEAIASNSAADAIAQAQLSAGIAKPVNRQTNAVKTYLGYTKDELVHLTQLTLATGVVVGLVAAAVARIKR